MIITFLVTSASFNIALAKSNSTLRYGNSGNEVKVLQTKLISIGYLKDKATGYFGKNTLAAVIKFQKDNRISANGIVGTATWNALNKRTSSNTTSSGQQNASPSTNNTKAITLKYGDTGNEVKELQTKLISMGYLNDKATGYFGKNTRDAVIEFQKKMGLRVTGVVYSDTLKLLASTVNDANKPEEKPVGNGNQNQESQNLLTLKYGDKGNEVKDLQTKLIKIGYLKSSATGQYDLFTRAAVIEFQKKMGLRVTGVAYSDTLNLLTSAVNEANKPEEKPEENGQQDQENQNLLTLKFGDKGNGVKDLQAKLIKIGYLKGSATGYYDLSTRSAVIEFQNKKGLRVTGVAYSDTLNLLASAVNEANKPEEKPEENGQQDQGDQDLPEPDSDFVQRKAEANSLKGKTVIIDPGHGFKQPGVVRDNVYEKYITLDMGLRLQRILQEAGAKVVMTRSTDGNTGEHYLYYRSAVANKHVLDTEIDKLTKEMDENRHKLDMLGSSVNSKGAELEKLKTSNGDQSKIKNIEDEIAKLMQQEQESMTKLDEQKNNIDDLKQKSASLDAYIKDPSLKSRVGIYSGGFSTANEELTEVFDLTNDKYQKDIVFISIHCNSTTSNETTASGIQIYVSDNNNSYYNQYYSNYNQIEREEFGKSLMEEMNSITPFSNKYYKLYKSNLSVLREHNLISALVEVGFVNNSSDRTLLTKEQTREDVAFGMYKGIKEYFD